MSLPPLFADFVDGRSARVHRVSLTLEQSLEPTLIINLPEAPPRRWRLSEIRRLPDQADRAGVALTVASNALARLYIAEPGVAAEIAALCPNLNRGPPVRGTGRIAGWAAGAVLSVGLIIFALIPLLANQLATVLPARGEKALGDATLEQVRAAFDQGGIEGLGFCESPAGRSALETMEARLVGDRQLDYELTVSVLDHDMINAFALPGGHIVFMRGMLDAAGGPDESAAVFAHEIGHVVSRDPVRITLRTAGSIGVLGLLLGDFAGGAVVLFLTERLIQAEYTQRAEAAADAFAHDMLIEARIDPAAIATLFERLREEYGDTEGFVQHFLSHPAMGDRIEAARQASNASGAAFTPALGKTGWRALKTICD